jgi:hypothetical protein
MADESWLVERIGEAIRDALEHGQFPLVSNLVQADDVKAPVECPDFDVTVVRAVPAIERFGEIKLTPAEMNTLGNRDPVVARFQLNANMHHFLSFPLLPY